jgi:hypothetical protein
LQSNRRNLSSCVTIKVPRNKENKNKTTTEKINFQPKNGQEKSHLFFKKNVEGKFKFFKIMRPVIIKPLCPHEKEKKDIKDIFELPLGG